ncbi:Phosphopantetheine adenylyltransferase [Acetivibrio saccincola]|jgi:pantetheine-phosphate adenylyltransferase|uniref:Phosphopantetheine adenylyltransferase n=1 Tax=Acetivibrio saccincola TaxID=1677857 RepID=A0A2K9ERE7_9FIRM|nr:pantetheine-phosphate adenylyltransferase [Acetivibrio saccincola]AUG58100.1 Phosphopantetheine adenylyltransferase [Acetivibrio saccincola]
MKVRIFVYPGSFDPITNGHLDIIKRASELCDKLIVAVLVNNSKKPVFSLEERVELIECAVEGIDNVEVESFTGLLIDFMKKKNATVIVKGLRAVSDFEYELQMALLNKKLDHNVETLFMMTNINYSFLSSSSVRELAKHNGNIDGLVPDCIIDKVLKRLRSN